MRRIAPVVLVVLAACGGEQRANAPGEEPPPALEEAPGRETRPAPHATGAVEPPRTVPEPLHRLAIEPAEVRFGFVDAEAEYRKSLRVTNAGSVAVVVDTAISGHASFALEPGPGSLPLSPGESVDLQVIYTPPEPSRDLELATVELVAGGIAYAVPVSAFASAECLRIEPNPVDCGKPAPEGYEKIKSLNVINCGTRVYEFEDVLCRDGDGDPVECFIVPPRMPYTLSAGELLKLDLVCPGRPIDVSIQMKGRSPIVVRVETDGG